MIVPVITRAAACRARALRGAISPFLRSTEGNEPMTTRTRIGLAGLALALGLATATPAEAASSTFSTSSNVVAHGTPLVVGAITLVVDGGELLIKNTAEDSIVWRSQSTGTCSTANCRLRVQGDGNLVILNDSSTAVWAAGTFGNSGATLTVQDTEPFVNVANGSTALWRTQDWLSKFWRTVENPQLFAGDAVSAGPVTLELSSTANLRVYYSGGTLWESGTSGTCSPATNCYAEFTTGGNLRVVTPAGTVWESGTATTAAGEVVLSRFRPYISVREGHKVLWAGTDNGGSVYSVGQALVRSGETRRAGTTSYKLTTAGNFEIRNAGGTVVYQTNTTATCVTSTCRVALQGDGNIVLYNDSGTGYWAAGTYDNNLSQVYLDQASPYLTLVSADAKPVWSAIAGAIAPSVPVTSASSSRGAGTTSALVQSFGDVIGVNTHMAQYETNASVVATKLNYLKIKRIRDGLPNAAMTTLYSTLAGSVSGLKLNTAANEINPTRLVSLLSTFKSAVPGVLESIEGPNEINNFGMSYYDDDYTPSTGPTGGVKGQVGWACKAAWPNSCGDLGDLGMTALKSAVAASSLGIEVLDLSGGVTAMDSTGTDMNVINTARADYGNVHPYSGDNQPWAPMSTAVGHDYGSTAPNAVITEVGFTTDGVSTTAQAILTLNALLSGYSLGYHRVFLYDLSDNNVAGWERFGLYNTAGNAKPAADAIHNLNTILVDPGVATSAGTLSWSISSGTAPQHSILFQKSGGKFDLILWDEPDVANGTTDVSVTPTSRTVNLGGVKSSVSVFDPISSATAISTTTSVSSVTVSLGSHPLVIEITP